MPKTLISIRRSLRRLLECIDEDHPDKAMTPEQMYRYEFEYLRDNFPIKIHKYPPKHLGRTRKKQHLTRLQRRKKRKR